MKFKIRYADQIVGILVVIALISLILVIFMIGRTQRWFSIDHNFKTYAQTASGISKNMPVTCRGITIGNVKDFRLTDDNRVKVIFTVQDEHKDRARIGSLVEVQVSAIGLGGQFAFYPGLGGELDDGAFVPMRDSPEARDYLAQGLAYIPAKDDPIGDLLNQADEMMKMILELFGDLTTSPNTRADTALGQTLVNIEQLTSNLAADMANPNGVRSIINGDAETLHALEASLISLSGILDSVEKAVYYVPREMPQILNLISEARTAVSNAGDILISLKNNPILRNGIPAHAEIDSSGTNPRNIRF